MQENSAVLNTIQSMTNQIFISIDNSLIDVLDRFLYVDEDLLKESTIFLFTNKIEMTMRVIAQSLLMGFVIYYLIRYLISRITASNKDELESPAVFFVKIVLSSIAILYSTDLCKLIIGINNNITIDFGNNLTQGGLLPTFSRFLKTVNQTLLGGEENINIFSIDGIFKGFVSFGTLNITVSFALRYILIKVLVIVAPIVFTTKVFSKTDKIFNMWLKTFISLLLIQHFIAILLVLAGYLKIHYLSTFNKIAYIGIIYALSKSFNIFERVFGAIAPDVQVSFPFK